MGVGRPGTAGEGGTRPRVASAEPTEAGLNILIATGLVQDSAQFVSVSASTVCKRRERAFKPFSATEALKFAAARK